MAVWHFFDFKGNDDAQADGPCDYLPDYDPPICGFVNTTNKRPAGLNHKGVVDYWRRTKPVFYDVTNLYLQAALDAQATAAIPLDIDEGPVL